MIARDRLMIQLIRLIFLFFLILIVSRGYSNEPERPVSVPKEAFWLGGIDGGVFVLIDKNAKDPPNVYQGTIFYPHGEVWYQGPFVLEPHDQLHDIDLKNQKIFVGWDGEVLLLSDGCSLRVKQQHNPH